MQPMTAEAPATTDIIDPKEDLSLLKDLQMPIKAIDDTL